MQTVWIAFWLLALLLGGCSTDQDDDHGYDDDAVGDDTADDDTADDDSAGDDDSVGDDDTVAPLQIAIYDDTAQADASAWGEGLDYIEEALQANGLVTQRITRNQLNNVPGLLQQFGAIVFGGGFAYPGYTLGIDAGGKARLQEFVFAGGAYVGICAGAYAACSSLDYEGEIFDTESGYTLDLYDGICSGPVADISSYPNWEIAQLNFPGDESYESYQGGSFDQDLWYAGGPFFDVPSPDSVVLATYENPGVEHQGAAAVIRQPYGYGEVVLWGPHPEVVGGDAQPMNRDLFVAVVSWAASLP